MPISHPLNKNRFQFYRALHRLQKEMRLFGQMSRMSVLTTHDEKLAKRVYALFQYCRRLRKKDFTMKAESASRQRKGKRE